MSATVQSSDFDAWIDRARHVPIEDEIARRGHALKRVGAELIGPCPVCGGDDRFSINPRKQVFYCRHCGIGGDVIALVRHLDQCGFKDAVATLNGDGTRTVTPQQKTGKRQDGQNNSLKAAWLWSQRKPITEGTPPWLYLRKRRYTGPIPATMGYLPAHDPYPASMIAAFGTTDEPEPGIITPPKAIVGVHLTRLTADGEKTPNAAGKTKIMLGVCKGAPITISPPNDLLGMAVTEGIEDALSVYQATGLGAWAAGAAGFMPALAPHIPDYIETITIYAHDDNGRGYAIDLARAIKVRGIEVLMQGL